MDLKRKPNGKWELRWREAGRYRSRTFDLKGDAIKFEAKRVSRKQLGHAAIPDDVLMRDFAKTYWRLHAIPNLADSTRDFYARALSNHIIPRLGDYGVREITPKRLRRFRDELERQGVGVATVRKSMAIVQSILSFAVGEELVEYNAARVGVSKPTYKRARAPHVFLPPAVEEIRSRLDLRDATLVSVLAYTGPRPEEVVCRLTWDHVGERTIRYLGTKRGGRERFTPLLAPVVEDLREWRLASGRPGSNAPVFPAHDGGFWSKDDWGRWRGSVWQSRPERRYKYDGRVKVYSGTVGCAPAGTRPRDLRSSYITLRVYEGIPLTTIARECGTSVTMIEQHYASVIENWDGQRVDAETQIRTARQISDRSAHVGLAASEGGL